MTACPAFTCDRVLRGSLLASGFDLHNFERSDPPFVGANNKMENKNGDGVCT
jgi:hypothetical protein